MSAPRSSIAGIGHAEYGDRERSRKGSRSRSSVGGHYCLNSRIQRQVGLDFTFYTASGPMDAFCIAIVKPPIPAFSATEWYVHSPGGIHATGLSVSEAIRSTVRRVAWNNASDLEGKFNELVDQWRRDTRVSSSSTYICMHESYQQIIGLGERAVPLILKEMLAGHLHWSWALTAITRQNTAAHARSRGPQRTRGYNGVGLRD